MRKALKLLYATCFLDVSGVTKINFDILSGISDDWDIHICTTQCSDPLAPNWDSRFVEKFGETLQLWRLPRRERYRYFVSYIQRHRIDLVYVTHSLWLYEHTARLKSDLPSVRIVDSLHVLEPYCFRGGYPDISANRFVHPYLDRSILISRDLFGYLTRNYPVDREKLVVIHNGIDTCRFEPSAGSGDGIRAELGLGSSQKLLGFIGRFSLQKRPLFFLEIARALCRCRPEISVYLVGGGPLEGKIRQRIVRYGLASRIHLLGKRDDIPLLLNATDLLLLPSAYEGAPLTMLEAFAVGVPVVASDVGAVKEYVSDQCRLVPLGRGGTKEREAFVGAALDLFSHGKSTGYLAPEHRLDEVISRYRHEFKRAISLQVTPE